MEIGSAEHKAWQEENGRKLRKSLQQTVEAGPKSSGMFDNLSYKFSTDLLNSLQSRKVKK